MVFHSKSTAFNTQTLLSPTKAKTLSLSKDQWRLLKPIILQWSNKFPTLAICDSNFYPDDKYSKFEFLLAVNTNAKPSSKTTFYLNQHKNPKQAFNNFIQKLENASSWQFGYFAYDLKNAIENLSSQNPNSLNFPDAFFFQPNLLFQLDKKGIAKIEGDSDLISELQQFISAPTSILNKKPSFSPLIFEPEFQKGEYIERVNQIKQHIALGDIYEANFCQGFNTTSSNFEPLEAYQLLNENCKSPFSAFLKFNDKYLICNSPERYLQKTENLLISQPIKGTIKSSADPIIDKDLKAKLKANPKELAENVMIVDLVRNDLAKIAKRGSVKVAELFGLYSFRYLHHLISTVKADQKPIYSPLESIQHSFPMGSMTGAPKIRAMQLMDQYEQSSRGLYSGSFGYIQPNFDFDFNVVIRSLLYDKKTNKLQLKVGGAITTQSNSEAEYHECLLKAKGVLKSLGAEIKISKKN